MTPALGDLVVFRETYRPGSSMPAEYVYILRITEVWNTEPVVVCGQKVRTWCYPRHRPDLVRAVPEPDWIKFLPARARWSPLF